MCLSVASSILLFHYLSSNAVNHNLISETKIVSNKAKLLAVEGSVSPSVRRWEASQLTGTVSDVRLGCHESTSLDQVLLFCPIGVSVWKGILSVPPEQLSWPKEPMQ